MQPLEVLWQLLDDWLNLLKVEFDTSTGESCCDKPEIQDSVSTEDTTQTVTPSTDKSNVTPKSETDTSNNSDVKVTLRGDVPRQMTEQGKEQLLKRLSVDQDVIGAVLPRICGVVQAFYICCSCQHSHPQ